MNGRERQFALEVSGRGIVAHAIRTDQEVRPAAEFFDRLPADEPEAEMVTIAKQILKQHEGPFDPTAFVDRYQAAVQALAAEKQKTKGVTVARSTAPNEAEVVDLMAALKASLAPPAPPPRRKTAASLELAPKAKVAKHKARHVR